MPIIVDYIFIYTPVSTGEPDYSESALHYLNNNADKCLGVAEGIGDVIRQP